ncbi:MAG: PKD domain-containing protein, partial [Thermoplasmata archaeon]
SAASITTGPAPAFAGGLAAVWIQHPDTITVSSVSDDAGTPNTYTLRQTGTNAGVVLELWTAPTADLDFVGRLSVGVTVSASGTEYDVIAVFIGGDTTSSIDVVSAANTGSSADTTAPITPNDGNDLVLAGLMNDASETASTGYRLVAQSPGINSVSIGVVSQPAAKNSAQTPGLSGGTPLSWVGISIAVKTDQDATPSSPWVATTADTTGATGQSSVKVDAPAVQGDVILLAVFVFVTGDPVASVADTEGNFYTRLNSYERTFTSGAIPGAHIEWWAATAGSSSPSNVATVTLSASPTEPWIVTSWDIANASAISDGTGAGTSGSGTGPFEDGVTTTKKNDLILEFVATNGNVLDTYLASAGYSFYFSTLLGDSGPVQVGVLGVAAATGGQAPGVSGEFSSVQWGALSVAIPGAPSSVPPLVIVTTASPTSGDEPLSVAFVSSASGGVPPYTYSWTFGDGGTSTQQNPVYIYTAAGVFDSTATVTDSVFTEAEASPIVITVSTSPTGSGGSKLSGRHVLFG